MSGPANESRSATADDSPRPFPPDISDRMSRRISRAGSKGKQPDKAPTRKAKQSSTTKRERKPPKEIQVELGIRIRELRVKKKLHKTRLARMAGIDDEHLGVIERGGGNVRVSTLVGLTRSLGTTIALLFRGLEREAKKRVVSAKLQEQK